MSDSPHSIGEQLAEFERDMLILSLREELERELLIIALKLILQRRLNA